MTHHQLKDRKEHEILWFERRNYLKAASTWLALGGIPAAIAQQRSNIVELSGDALCNGRPLQAEQVIRTGDQIQTGPGAGLVFAMGNAAFRVRQNTTISIEPGTTPTAVKILRIVTGAVVSIWSKGDDRIIITPTLVAGIRGTGAYTEVMPQRNNRTYFCNCYGKIALQAGKSKVQSQSNYHQSFWVDTTKRGGKEITPAGYIDHTDEELEFLAALIGQRTYWQMMGRKGKPDGKGTMGY